MLKMSFLFSLSIPFSIELKSISLIIRHPYQEMNIKCELRGSNELVANLACQTTFSTCLVHICAKQLSGVQMLNEKKKVLKKKPKKTPKQNKKNNNK